MKLRISGIVNDSIVDGPGIRLTIFTQGCLFNCPNCHNPQTHDLNGGYEQDISEIIALIEKNPLLDGVTISGGEPFLQPEALLNLVKQIKPLSLSVMIYSGYTFEQLINDETKRALLQEIDYLVDGLFIEELKSLELLYRGSSNQRLIDVQASLKADRVVELNINEYGEIIK